MKTLTQKFIDLIVPLLRREAMDTQTLYGYLEQQDPELCCDLAEEKRPYCVWQRNARNALTELQKQKVIGLDPRPGYERKGHYRLLGQSAST